MMRVRISSTSLLIALVASMVISVSFSADIHATKTIKDGESTRYDDTLQYRLKRQTKNEFNSMQIRAPTKRQQMVAASQSASSKPGMAFVKKDNSVSVSEPALNPNPDRAFSFPMPAEPASPVALHHRAFNFPGVDPLPDHGSHTEITASQNQATSAKIGGTSNLDVLTKLSAPVTEQSQGTSSQNAVFQEIRKAILSHHARELLKSVMKTSPSFNSQPDLFEPRTPGTLSAGHINYLQIRNRPLHFDRQRKPEPTNTLRNDVPEIQAGLVDVTPIEPQIPGNQDTFLNSHHEGSFSSSMMGMPLNHAIPERHSAFRIATSRVISPLDLQPTSTGARETGIATSGQSALSHVGSAHGHTANQPFVPSNSHQTHRMETHVPHNRVHTVVTTSTKTPPTSTTPQPTTTKAATTTNVPPSPSTTTTRQTPTAPTIGTINLTSSSTPQSSVPQGMHISTSTNKPSFPASSGAVGGNVNTQGNTHSQVSPPHHPIINLHINFHQPTHQQPSNMAVQQNHPPQSNAQFVASGQHNSPQHIGVSRMMVPNQPNQPMIDMNVIHNITQAVVASWLRKTQGGPVMQTHSATNINSIPPVEGQQQNNNVVRAGLVNQNAVSPNQNAASSGPVNNNTVSPGSANQNSAISGSTNQFPLPNPSSSSIHSSIWHATSTMQKVPPHHVPAGAKTSGSQLTGNPMQTSSPQSINLQQKAHTSTVATPTVPQHHSKSNHVEWNPTNTVTTPSTVQHIATSQQKSNLLQQHGTVNTAPAPIGNQQTASNANIQNSIPSTTNQKLFMSSPSGRHSTANSQTGTHVTTGNTASIPHQANTKMMTGAKVSNNMQGNQQGPQSTKAQNVVNTQQTGRHSTANSQTGTHVTTGNTPNISSQSNTKMMTGAKVSNNMQGNQQGPQSTKAQNVVNTQQTSSQPQLPFRETANIQGPTTVLTSQSAAGLGILMPQMLRGVHTNPNGQHAAVPNIPIHHSQKQPQNPHVTTQQNNYVKVGNSQQNLHGSGSSSPNMRTLNQNVASTGMNVLPHQPSNMASQVSSVSTSTGSQTSLMRGSNSGTSHLPQPSGNTAHQRNTNGTPSTVHMSPQGTKSQKVMNSVSQQQSNGNTAKQTNPISSTKTITTAGSQTLPLMSTNNARPITTLQLGQTSGHNSGHNGGTHNFMNLPGHLHPISTSSVSKASHNAGSNSVTSSSQTQQRNMPHQSSSRSQTQSQSKTQRNQQLAGHQSNREPRVFNGVQGIPEIKNSAMHVETISQKSSSLPQASNASPNTITMTTNGQAQQITERQNILPHQSSSSIQQFNTVPASPSGLLSSQSIGSNAGTGNTPNQPTSIPTEFQSVASAMKPQPTGSQLVVNPAQLQSGTMASQTSLVLTNGHGSSHNTGSQTNPHVIPQHSSNMIQQVNTVSTSKNREAPQNTNIPVHLNGASASSPEHVTSPNAVGNTGISSSSQKSNTSPSHVNSVPPSPNAQLPIGSQNTQPVNLTPINEQMLQNMNIQTVMNNLPQQSNYLVQQVNTVSTSSMGTKKSLPNLSNSIRRQVNSVSSQTNGKLPLQNLGSIVGVSNSPQQFMDIPPSQFNTASTSSKTQQHRIQAQTSNSPQQFRDIPPSQFNTVSTSSQTQQQGSQVQTSNPPRQFRDIPPSQFNTVSTSSQTQQQGSQAQTSNSPQQFMDIPPSQFNTVSTSSKTQQQGSQAQTSNSPQRFMDIPPSQFNTVSSSSQTQQQGSQAQSSNSPQQFMDIPPSQFNTASTSSQTQQHGIQAQTSNSHQQLRDIPPSQFNTVSTSSQTQQQGSQAQTSNSPQQFMDIPPSQFNTVSTSSQTQQKRSQAQSSNSPQQFMDIPPSQFNTVPTSWQTQQKGSQAQTSNSPQRFMDIPPSQFNTVSTSSQTQQKRSQAQTSNSPQQFRDIPPSQFNTVSTSLQTQQQGSQAQTSNSPQQFRDIPPSQFNTVSSSSQTQQGSHAQTSNSPQQFMDIPPSQFNTVSSSSQTQQRGSQAQTSNSPQQFRDIPPSQFNTVSSSSQTQQQMPESRTSTNSFPQQPSNVVEQFNSVSSSANGNILQTTVPRKAERHPSLPNTHHFDQITALTSQQQLSSQFAGQSSNNINNQPSRPSNQGGPSQSVQQSSFSSHTVSQNNIGRQRNMLLSQIPQHNPSTVEAGNHASTATHTDTQPSQTKSPRALIINNMPITNQGNTNQQRTANQASNQQSSHQAVNGQLTHTITKPGTPSSNRVSSHPANIQNTIHEQFGGGQGQVSQNNQGQTISTKLFTSRTTLTRQEFPQNNQQLTNNQGRHTPATTSHTQNIQTTNLIEQPIGNNVKQQSNAANHITQQSGAHDKVMNSQHTKVQSQSVGHQRNTLQASPNKSPSNQVNTIHELLSGNHGNSMSSQSSINQGWSALDQTMNQQNKLHNFQASKQMSNGVQSNTITSTPVEKMNPMNSQSSGINQLPVQVGQPNHKSTISSQQITQVGTNTVPTGNREMQHRSHGNIITTQTKTPSTKQQTVQHGNAVVRSHITTTGQTSNVNTIQNAANSQAVGFTGTNNVFSSSNGQVLSPSSGSQTVMSSISQQSRNTPDLSGGQTSIISSTKSNTPKIDTSPVNQNGIPPPSATLVQSSVNSLSFGSGIPAQTMNNGKMIKHTHMSNSQGQPEINQISTSQVKRIDSKLGRTSPSQPVTQTGQVNSQIGQLSPSTSTGQTSQHMAITAGHQATVPGQLTGQPKPVHKAHSKTVIQATSSSQVKSGYQPQGQTTSSTGHQVQSLARHSSIHQGHTVMQMPVTSQDQTGVQQQTSAGHMQGQAGQQIETKPQMQLKNIPSPPKDHLVHQTQHQTAGATSNRIQGQQSTVNSMTGQGNTGQHPLGQSNGSPSQNTKAQVRQQPSSQSTVHTTKQTTRTSSQHPQSSGVTGHQTHAQKTATNGHQSQSPGQPSQTVQHSPTGAQPKHQSNPPSTNMHGTSVRELNAQKSSGPAAKVKLTQQEMSTSNLVEKHPSPNSNKQMIGSPTAPHWSAVTPGDTLFASQNLQHSSPIGWVSPIVSDINRNAQLQNSPPELLSASTSRMSTAQIGTSQKNSPKTTSGTIIAPELNTKAKGVNQAQQTSSTQSAGQTKSSIIKEHVQPVVSMNKMPKETKSNTLASHQHNQAEIIATVSISKSQNQKQTSSPGVSHDITSAHGLSPSLAPPSGQASKIPNNPTTPGKHVLRIGNNAVSSTGSSNTVANVHQANKIHIEVSGSSGQTTNPQSVLSGTTPQLSQRNINHLGNGIGTSQRNQHSHAQAPQSVQTGTPMNSLPKSSTSKMVLSQTSVVAQQNGQTHEALPQRQRGHSATQMSGQSNRHSSVHRISQNGKNTIQAASTKATSKTINQPNSVTSSHREIAQIGQQANSPTITPQRRMTHNAHPSNSPVSSQMGVSQNSQMTSSQIRRHQNSPEPSNPVSSKTGMSQKWIQPITSSQMGSVQNFQQSTNPVSSSTRTSKSVRHSKPTSFQMPNSQVGQTHASFTMGTSQIHQQFNQPMTSSINQMPTQRKQINHVQSSQNVVSSIKQSKSEPPATQSATRSHVSTHSVQHGAKQSQLGTHQNRHPQSSQLTSPSMTGHQNEKRPQRNNLLQRGSKTLHVVRQHQNSPTISTGMNFIHQQPNTVSSQTHTSSQLTQQIRPTVISQPRISSSSQQQSVSTLGTKPSPRSQQNSPRSLTQFTTSQTGQQNMRTASSQIGLTQPAIQTNPTVSTNLLTGSMTRNTIVSGHKQGSNRQGTSSSTQPTGSQPTAGPTGNRGASRQLSQSDMLSSSRPLTAVPNNLVTNRKLVPTVQSNNNPSLNQRVMGNSQLRPTHIAASRGITNTAYSNTELGLLSPNLHLQDVASTDFAFMHPTGSGNGYVNMGTQHGTAAPFVRPAVVVDAPYAFEVSTVNPKQPIHQVSVVVSEHHRPSVTFTSSPMVQVRSSTGSTSTTPSTSLPRTTTVSSAAISLSSTTTNMSSGKGDQMSLIATTTSVPETRGMSTAPISATPTPTTLVQTTPKSARDIHTANANSPVRTAGASSSVSIVGGTANLSNDTATNSSTGSSQPASNSSNASTKNILVSASGAEITSHSPKTAFPSSISPTVQTVFQSPMGTSYMVSNSSASKTQASSNSLMETTQTNSSTGTVQKMSSSSVGATHSMVNVSAATSQKTATATTPAVITTTPSVTTNTPKTKTNTPKAKPNTLVATTQAPVSATKAPASKTKAPASTTKAPASTANKPVSKANTLAATTQAPATTTQAPASTTKPPASTTKTPTSTTKIPASTTKEPPVTTKVPTSTTNAPAATTKLPSATTKVPASTTKTPASTTKTPAATTKEPAATTKVPASTTKTPAATTKEPASTTKALASITNTSVAATKAPASRTNSPAATTQTTHSSMTTSQAISPLPASKGGFTTVSPTVSPNMSGGSRTVTPATVSLSTNTISIDASKKLGSSNVNVEHFNSPMFVHPEKITSSVVPEPVSSPDTTGKGTTVAPLNQLSSIPISHVISTDIGGTKEVLTPKIPSSPSRRVEQGYKLHGGLYKILNSSHTDKTTLSYSNNPTAKDIQSIPVDVHNMAQNNTSNTNSVSKEAQNSIHAYPMLSTSATATPITKNETQIISQSQHVQKGTTAVKDNSSTYPKQVTTANVRRQNDGNNKTRTTNSVTALDQKAVDAIASRILTSLVKMVAMQTANDIHQNSIHGKNSLKENNNKTTQQERKDQLSAEITRRLSTSLEQLSLNRKLNHESPSPQVMPEVKNVDARNNSTRLKTVTPSIPTPSQMSTYQETTTIQQTPIQPVNHMQKNQFSAVTQLVTISTEGLLKQTTQPSSPQLPVKTEQNPGNQQYMGAPNKITVLLDATETAPTSATMTVSIQGLETHTAVANHSKLKLLDKSNHAKAHHAPLPKVSAGGFNLDVPSSTPTPTTIASQNPTELSTISTNSVTNNDISTQPSIQSTVVPPLTANSRKTIGGSRLATVSQSSSNHHTAVSSTTTQQPPSAKRAGQLKPVDPSIVPLKSIQTSKSSPEISTADNVPYRHSVLAVTTTVSPVTGESLSKKLIAYLNNLLNTSHPIANDNSTSKITMRPKLDISGLKANTFESPPLHSTVVRTTMKPPKGNKEETTTSPISQSQKVTIPDVARHNKEITSTTSTRQVVGVTASTIHKHLITKSTAVPSLLTMGTVVATKSPKSVMQPSTSPSAIIARTTTGPIFRKHEVNKSTTGHSHSSVSTTPPRPFPRNGGQTTAAAIPDNSRPIPNATDKGQSSQLARSVDKMKTQQSKSPGIGHETTTSRLNIKDWEFAAISAGILKTTPSTQHEWLPHSFPVIPEVPKGLEFLSLKPRKERTSSNSLLRKLVLNSLKPEKQMQISKEGLLLSDNSVITNNVVQPNQNMDLKQDLVNQHSNGMHSTKMKPTKSSIVQSNLQDPQLIQQLVSSRTNVDQSSALQVYPMPVSKVGHSLSEPANHLQSSHTDGMFNTKDIVNGISSNADMFKVLKNAVTKQDRMPGETGTGNSETYLKQTKTVDNPAYKVNQIMYPRDISVPALEMIVDVPHGRLNPVKPTIPSHAEHVI